VMVRKWRSVIQKAFSVRTVCEGLARPIPSGWVS
jgi:hypothetical protein